ncbi:hypothetical protein B0O80DRAFT_424731 [Mortierella sp. GBAus27b]|nr:hypothetical protein B0O80DRAFT_424731 [Mortierella sp. GBAus27b]
MKEHFDDDELDNLAGSPEIPDETIQNLDQTMSLQFMCTDRSFAGTSEKRGWQNKELDLSVNPGKCPIQSALNWIHHLQDVCTRLKTSTKRETLNTFWKDLADQEAQHREHQRLMNQRKMDIRIQNVDQFRSDGEAMTREVQQYLNAEAPVHSFLVDCGNPNVRALFKEKDWNEIITLDRKPRPTLPNWLLRQLLECSRQESKAKMCKLPRSGWEPLLQLSNGDEDQEQDMDQNSGDGSEEEDDGRATAINPIEHNSESVGEKENITFSLYRAILNIFAEYASTSQDIRSSHGSEGWFSTHISGALIDGLLSDLPDVQLLRGEKMSISSSRRKNLGRDVATTKAHGHVSKAPGQLRDAT